MIKKIGLGIIFGIPFLLLSSCNTTKSSKDVPTIPMASSRFEAKDCYELSNRKSLLDKYEQRLVKEQDKRHVISTGMVWTVGVGLGENDTAEQLGLVRGEKRAIKKAMLRKGCEILPDSVDEKNESSEQTIESIE